MPAVASPASELHRTTDRHVRLHGHHDPSSIAGVGSRCTITVHDATGVAPRGKTAITTSLHSRTLVHILRLVTAIANVLHVHARKNKILTMSPSPTASLTRSRYRAPLRAAQRSTCGTLTSPSRAAQQNQLKLQYPDSSSSKCQWRRWLLTRQLDRSLLRLRVHPARSSKTIASCTSTSRRSILPMPGSGQGSPL